MKLVCKISGSSKLSCICSARSPAKWFCCRFGDIQDDLRSHNYCFPNEPDALPITLDMGLVVAVRI